MVAKSKADEKLAKKFSSEFNCSDHCKITKYLNDAIQNTHPWSLGYVAVTSLLKVKVPELCLNYAGADICINFRIIRQYHAISDMRIDAHRQKYPRGHS